MTRRPEIAIGTAAFGMGYGVDSNGLLMKRVKHPEVGKILALGGLSGIKMIDTAAAYGTAIKSLGRYANKIDQQKMKIVYKLPTYDRVNQSVLNSWDAVISEDLGILKMKKIYCVMVHNAEDFLRGNGALLYNYLNHLKKEGICEKIGVSVYFPYQMSDILDRYHLDIVQLPTSIFDQRFDRTYLRKIKKRSGIEIHSRSLFLQGKMFQDPSTLGKNFSALKARLKDLNSLGLTPLEASLDYLAGLSEVDYAIIGVHSPLQLTDIILQYRKATGRHDWTAFLIPNPREINPTLW